MTPTLSVAAAHVRLICVLETTFGSGVPGAVGGVVSGAAWVVALATAEYGPRLLAASVARTR